MKSARLILLSTLCWVAGCGTKSPDSAGSAADTDTDTDTDADADADADADDTGSACDTDLGTIEGVVIEDFSWSSDEPGPSPGARVFARQVIGDTPIETIADDSGAFVFQLPEGTWSLTSSTDENCLTTETTQIELSACAVETTTLTVDDCFDGRDTG